MFQREELLAGWNIQVAEAHGSQLVQLGLPDSDVQHMELQSPQGTLASTIRVETIGLMGRIEVYAQLHPCFVTMSHSLGQAHNHDWNQLCHSSCDTLQSA